MDANTFFRRHLKFFSLSLGTGYLLGSGFGLVLKHQVDAIWFTIGIVYLAGSALGTYLMIDEWNTIHPRVK